MKNVTFVVTQYKRLGCLSKCIESIHKWHPEADVEVSFTKGNLSRGRNEAVKRVDTPYIFLMEDDMELIRETNISALLDVIVSDERIAGVGGGLREPGGDRCCAGIYDESADGRKRFKDGAILHSFPHQWIECSHIYNWGVFRTKALREIRWDERLSLYEHGDFFYRLCQKGPYVVGATRNLIAHSGARPSPEYKKMRDRKSFKRIEVKLMGGPPATGGTNERIWRYIDRVLHCRGITRWDLDGFVPRRERKRPSDIPAVVNQK